MNREQEIRKAGHNYKEDYGSFNCDLDDVYDAFCDGAEWADSHLANRWHKNIDGDLPKESGRYLVMAQNGYCHTCKYKADSRYWDTVGYQSDIKYWMEMPELPTE